MNSTVIKLQIKYEYYEGSSESGHFHLNEPAPLNQLYHVPKCSLSSTVQLKWENDCKFTIKKMKVQINESDHRNADRKRFHSQEKGAS